jgi:hypothetical protein
MNSETIVDYKLNDFSLLRCVLLYYIVTYQLLDMI